MNPFFFGDSSEPLYGVHHPPAAGSGRGEGVVLCYPFGQEYMRAHRAFRQLSLLLSRAGFHVLRFDYRGTGDSGRNLEEVSAGHWVEDIIAAERELREVAGVERVTVVGLRLGALIAGEASRAGLQADRLVAWDPVNSGPDYLAEIGQLIDEDPGCLSNFRQGDGVVHINGFGLTESIQQSLGEMSLLASPPTVGRSLLVVSHENAAFSALRGAWKDAQGFQYQYTAAPHDWNYVDDFGGILLPQPIIQAIVSWMEHTG